MALSLTAPKLKILEGQEGRDDSDSSASGQRQIKIHISEEKLLRNKQKGKRKERKANRRIGENQQLEPFRQSNKYKALKLGVPIERSSLNDTINFVNSQ